MNEAMMLNFKQTWEVSKRYDIESQDMDHAGQNAEKENTVDLGGEDENGDWSESIEEESAVSSEQTVIESRQLKEEVKKIRVLLMDSEYESYYHPSVSVKYDGKEETYTLESEILQNGTIEIQCDGEGIVISSIDRQQRNPKYQGKIEIRKTEQGLLVINELPVEQYLEAVVPSEMPSSYAEEALKAQAVCARTYAYKHMEKQSLKKYGADVDDSVNYQVYGNIEPQESTNKAISETAGQVMYQNQELIDAYYFSTSAGVTSTDEVWGAQEAASFLKSVECVYDSDEIWSSWSGQIPWNILQERVNLVYDDDARLLNLEVKRKSQSGAVIEMTVVTDGGNYTLSGEYEVREFLSPKGIGITGNDGVVRSGGALLPSAYFEMETYPEEYAGIVGRGYGHGVGMSQNAADEMARQGYTWKEILEYFFKDIEIGQMSGNI